MVMAQNDAQEPTVLRQRATQLSKQGNWQDALNIFSQLIVDKRVPGAEAAADLTQAYFCMEQLGLAEQLDPLIVKGLELRSQDWRFLAQAARTILRAPHYGQMDGELFVRTPRLQRGNGAWKQSNESDRHQALKWFEQALKLCGELGEQPAADIDRGTAKDRAELWKDVLGALLQDRNARSSWRLQIKTDIDARLDYSDDVLPYSFPQRDAPVDENGRPVFHALPESWAAAQSDGQRCRWALQRTQAQDDPDTGTVALFEWVLFLQSQFAVDTLRDQLWIWSMQSNRAGQGDPSENEQTDGNHNIADQMAALLEVHTLTDEETIAKLASGIQRFKFPEDQNPIRMLKTILERKSPVYPTALQTLAGTYLNRRQNSQAAKVYRVSLEKGWDDPRALQTHIDDIVLARGRFEHSSPQVVGQPVKLELNFRNAKKAKFTARRVDLEKLLTRVKTDPRHDALPFELLQGFAHAPEQFEQQIEPFLSAPVASWNLDLEPSENHWDKRVDVVTPLDKGGMYIVDVNLDEGIHRARCSLWVNELVLATRPVGKESWLYAADAVTGAPLPNTNIEFIGYGAKFSNFARKTNAEGQVRIAANEHESMLSWIAIARDSKGRVAISAPHSMDYYSGQPEEFDRPASYKVYGVVEQPIYRPGSKVRAKLWFGEADYANAKPIRKQTFAVWVADPRGNMLWKSDKTTDNSGGVELEFDLTDSAPLGMYTIGVAEPDPNTVNPRYLECNTHFRVEEFRKPEFEVLIDAPDKAVQLGEPIEAKIRARYYFGTPVTDATVHVKVTRSAFQDDWYPVRPFDWCYGRGYWWFSYAYDWYPRWHEWQGCFPVSPSWRPWGTEPPEIVFDQVVKLDGEGVATIRFDSAMAAKFQGKQDHRYEISVEVRDASRRTITASGSVVAARHPFKIYSWLDRGYYRVGETIEANFMAQTLNRKPVLGSGKLELLRISYDAKREPQETLVESWDARTDEEGRFTHKLTARRGGQYRLRLKLKDEAGHEVEGATIFTIRGDNQTADNFRFSELELIPDKPEYAVGEKVELQINADRADATVLVFVRAQNMSTAAPRLVKLVNKTGKVTIDVTDSDYPNFFVDAFTIYNGKFYQSVREIFVPPIKKALEVKVVADKKEYLPGEKAKLSIEVKDLAGKPVAGNLLVSVYDRSLEQIAGDVLPMDIREFFWKWRRSYNPSTQHMLNRATMPLEVKDVPAMRQLGLFDELLTGMYGMGGGMGPGGMGGGLGGMRMPGEGRIMMLGMEATPMAAPATGGTLGGMGGDAGAVAKASAPAETNVRKEFADSALWLTNVSCDASGRAQAEMVMPENLTDWQIRVWSIDRDLKVGSGASSAVTHKNILIRMATPRFLTERDQVVLSAIVHNDFDASHEVQVRLEIDGETQLVLAPGTQASQKVTIEAHQQKRVDWLCTAVAEGEVTLRAFAQAAAQSDALEIKLPIIVHGTLKTDSWAGTIRPENATGRIKITIPKDRRPAQSRLTVRVSPSLASAVVDALPYMVSYPHGCTEQTLNRFLPTVLAQRMLIDMQIDLKRVKEHRQNANAQQLGDPAKRAAQWKSYEEEPVFDNDEVARMIERGVQRLTDMQNPDGGWGWFYEHSSAHTTATVVRGLIVARDSGAAIVPSVIERGQNWLQNYQANRLEKWKPDQSVDATDALVFNTLTLAGSHNEAMQKILYENRNQLGVYGKVLLGLATHKLGNTEQTNMLRQNIEQFLVQDAENETAFLRDQSAWWSWWGSSNESTACYLKLLSAVDAKNPTAARLVKYLLNNRMSGTRWKSTRDTALVVEAFTDYLKATGENKQSVSGEVLLGGKRLGSFQITPDTLFTADNTIEISGNAVPEGEHELELRKQGEGPLYFSIYSTNFTLEEEIAPAGLEVKIERRYYRLDPVKKKLDQAGDRGQALETQRATFSRVPIEDLQAIAPGTLVEVELLIDSKNDYEYLLIEERKAAGLEAVDTQSGSIWGQSFYAYRELRDKQVSFYIDHLPRGQHVLSYQLRAEAPGQFTALPAIISGMYAPELVGNSSDKDIAIKE